MAQKKISTDFNYQSHYVDVNGSNIHYIEQGTGKPILFLHGMPTSCYTWRNIIPHLSKLGRCIAPDLIGMGKSDKPDIDYSIEEHIKYIDGFIAKLDLKKIILVVHGWGSVIGLHYAMHHEDNCIGLVVYESYLRALHDEDISLPFQEQLSLIEDYKLTNNIIDNGAAFVEQMLSPIILRTLTNEELNIYKAPFNNEGSGKPLKQYLEELPKNPNNNPVNNLISIYSKLLLKSKLPKLLLYSVPGFLTTIATVMWAKENIPQLEIAEVGEGLHYAQESDPTIMAQTMSIWLQGL